MSVRDRGVNDLFIMASEASEVSGTENSTWPLSRSKAVNEENTPAMETPDQTPAGRIDVGWGFWALWVAALAVVGALSYRAGAVAPLAGFTLPPATMMIFGFLAGGVLGFAFRRQVPPARRWILTSCLAGFLAACVSVLSTSLAETPAGLLAGWAYAWAVYGAVLGVMLQRISPGRWLMLASLAGWATAGIVSGAAGWALDVFQVTGTDPALSPLPSSSRTWSMMGLAVVGAVCGATGGAITGAALVLLSRAPVLQPDRGARQVKDTRLVKVAGVVSGLIAAVLCTYLAPLAVTVLTQGSLDSLDLTIFFLSVLAGTPLCVPAIALVSIPLGIGCGYVGLEIGRARGRPDSRPWIWSGAAIGGVAGYLLGSLVAFAVGHM